MAEPRRFVDLHTHSTASDGTAAPAEVIRLAEAAGLAGVALTDHDTVAGLADARAAAGACPDLHFVPGIEISARFSPGMLHILGLGVDEGSPGLLALLAEFRAARDARNPRLVARLQALGLAIDMDDVRAAAAAMRGPAAAPQGPEILGRIHIAEAMVAKGLVPTRRAAFDRYIGEGGPAYVEKDRLGPGEVIGRLRACGAAAVLAHPGQLRCPDAEGLERLVREFTDFGLDGIEVYHSDHTPEQTRQYLDLARRLGLLVTGGSDYHGQAKPTVRLGLPRVPLAAIPEPWASRWFGGGMLPG